MKSIKYLLFGTVAIAALGFTTAASADEINHTVTSSDTLTGLSLKYYGDTDHVQTIADANDIANIDMIFDGEVLTFDTDAAAGSTKAAESEAVSSESENTAAATTAAAATTEADDAASSESGTVMYMTATAYSYAEGAIGGGYYTATGQDLRSNPTAVAVDPSVIPLGTRLYVEGYGEAVACDTGGAIQGNIIDVHFADPSQAEAWGRQTVKVTVLN